MKLSMIITSVSAVAVLTVAATQFATAARQPDKNLKDQAQKGLQDVKNKVDKAVKDATGQPDHDKMMEEMMKLAQIGPEHKRLANMVGTWDCSAKFVMPSSDGSMQEMESKGEAKIISELDGRWFRQDYKGDMMGEVFKGIGYTGYDNGQKKYVATWMDTMSTGMMTMTGTFDEATKTMTMQGTCDMPGMGETKFRHTTVEKDPNTVVFTMYRTGPDGKEIKEGEITYKRR